MDGLSQLHVGVVGAHVDADDLLLLLLLILAYVGVVVHCRPSLFIHGTELHAVKTVVMFFLFFQRVNEFIGLGLVREVQFCECEER